MVSNWQAGDWILGTAQEIAQHSRLAGNASPQSERSSNATAIQEPSVRPPVGDQPSSQVSPNQALPQKYASLPASPLDQNTGHKDTRTSTDPGTHDRFLLFPPATLAEQACLFHWAQARRRTPLHYLIIYPTLLDKDLVKPGAVLFSTGPVMSKAPSGPPPSTDPARRSSGDRTFWAAPSGVPSTNPSSDSTPAQDRETVPPPGYQPDTPSLVYTTGHSANTSSHPGYPHPYPTYPGNAPFGPSSPRHPSFGGPPNSSPMSKEEGTPILGRLLHFPTIDQACPSPVAGGYPTSPSSGNYQGSSVGGGYSSPTGAYGMHFAPYGMVSGPPMYAPATYAHAPYGHPYLPPQGHTDDGPTSGMWWFMPAGGGSAPPVGTYGGQPPAQQFLQRFDSSQQSSHPMAVMLNTNSSHPQGFPNPVGLPPPPAAHSPRTALSPVSTGPAPSAASPHQMYAAFGAMSLQSPQPPMGRQLPALTLPIHTHTSSPSAPPSASVQSPVQPTSTSKGRASAASKAGPGGSRVTSPATRRPWHPNPPVARSDWVMWDTTAREPVATTGPTRTLLPPVPLDKQDGDVGGTSAEHSHGVSSVFLISRSNCAFVNYEEEVYLNRAVSFFNGRPLRPKDPRCPRLVCRVRRKDDDLRAGVGGQRGMGMHARVQEQERKMEAASGIDAVKDKEAIVDDPATSPSTYLGATSSSGSSPPIPAPVDDVHQLPADLLGRPHAGDPKDYPAAHHSGSGSTNSSFLIRNFPKRYFILKSLTPSDLNTSVDRGLWATQAHNESTLDRAYRTSKDVYLIFSANKSGEWFGYARMDGPIIGSQQSVSWESRGPSRSPTSPTVQRKPEATAGTSVDGAETGQLGAKPAFFSPVNTNKYRQHIPAPTRIDGQISAPAEMGQAHKQLTKPDGAERNNDATGPAGEIVQADTFKLDQSAPYRAARTSSALASPSKEQGSHMDGDGVVHLDTALTVDLERARGLSRDPSVHPIRETLPKNVEADDKADSWGKPFKIRWIKTERLPFHRTRHLRNPWNSDREVKVSRDGTEVEPGVGQRLLDEWDRVVEEPEPTSAGGAASSSRNPPSRSGAQQSALASAPAPSTSRGNRACPMTIKNKIQKLERALAFLLVFFSFASPLVLL
ncbi:YT521-B-like domain [Rhizoctonia solani]|uniref:YT521-B-like domain n=1 Tax=Rhizoctonia solani TaxID=456999 RepID=A0A8H7M926_9AGAM|nr:YT521-B-like domain [Rhizoctonia solani]